MLEAPSPVEYRNGGYLVREYLVSSSKNYLHSDGVTCFLGRSLIPHADGRVTQPPCRPAAQPPGFAGFEGTWKGDAVYVEVRLGTRSMQTRRCPQRRETRGSAKPHLRALARHPR